MFRRLLETPVTEEIHDTIDDLENRIEDLEDDASQEVMPDTQYEMGQTVQALRGDIERLEREIATIASAPFEALEPLESRLQAVESRLADHSHEAEEEVSEDVSGVSKDVVEIPESVVVPKRRHFYHDLPKWL